MTHSRCAGRLVALVLSLPALATAGELAILPPGCRLVGPGASQRLILEDREGDVGVGDLTGRATFVSDNPAVAVVDPDGTVRPVGDGNATITARLGTRTATATVSVEGHAGEPRWSFVNHVEPVLTRAGCNSGACHGAAAGKGGFRLSLRGYDPEGDHRAITRDTLGRRVVPSAPAESLLLLKPTGALEHGGGLRFGPESREYQTLAGWVAAGMEAPRSDEARVVSLRTWPDAVRLRPGDSQSLLVQAVYSDGRVDDVTALARFTGSDDSVARVDESGRLRVEGSGQASVTVIYASLVSRTTVTVPYPDAPDARVYREAPRRNRIDELNLAHLRMLGLPPSSDAGDAAFLRRAYLDATGTLPPRAVAEGFLADKSQDRRAKLVDRILASPEFVDYWAYRWSDLLLVSSNKLPAPAVWSFYRFVRNAVATNQPWDRFARDVVTARGSALRNGAANYFVLHRDPIDLTESTSMAFLGLSLTCARCHNHPLEKWTQDQYYGMASLFSRVRLKDGTAPGDVVVVPDDQGEVRHPRTGKPRAPQPLDAPAVAPEATGDRRQAFADWLARPDNPYFARAAVNRVWANFFGRGLVHPEDDLRASNPPSDPALLDWLEHDFVASGYDIRRLIRTVMTSAVYARSSVPVGGRETDPRHLSHYPVKRLPAEVLLDAISQVTAVPTKFPGYPDGWRSLQLPDTKVDSLFLASFGRPERLNTCSCERSAEPSMAQALHLANGGTVNEKLRDPKGAAARALASGASNAEILDGLFLEALTRRPTPAERKRILGVLDGAAECLKDPKAAAEARRQAVEDLYWATLTSREFLFNH